MSTQSEKSEVSFKTQPQSDFFNYFGKERWIQIWLAEKRTRLTSVIFPPLEKIGIVPDTISYIGIAFLAGAILYFVRKPWLAALFLLGHVIFDGLDGAYARNVGKASQSGAFTDLVCDQFGMVVVSMLAIFHHLVEPLIGAAYISLYLIVVVFGVIINVMGIGSRITITSKYFLYIVYGFWAFSGVNYFWFLMTFFSSVMAIEVLIGYVRLKAGIKKKFDSQEHSTQSHIYSGHMNHVLNIVIPLTVLAGILVYGNWIPLRAIMDSPNLKLNWEEGRTILSHEDNSKILSFGVWNDKWLGLFECEDGSKEIRIINADGSFSGQRFEAPAYIQPACEELPLDGETLLIADNTTRLVMGIDLTASLESKKAVITLTLPYGYLRMTAIATTLWNNKTVWLVANYLFTRKTYIVDPDIAVKKGSVLGGVIGSYTNGGFPSGLVVSNGEVIELNKSPLNSLIYTASLNRMLQGENLLQATKKRIAPPNTNCLGLAISGGKLMIISEQGKTFHVPLKEVLGKYSLELNSHHFFLTKSEVVKNTFSH
ncbi:MAG: CDP-alcohol phosphatidyltransferase family protein [Deltaproteobacteria bacterium]|nr:CDP-alcohol phosphatidyltransferase family protein [Deltaproteobacteria bacterium]